MRVRTSFPYETTHEDTRIPLSDGTRLYARVWRPVDRGPGPPPGPVPALLEYVPYRLTDATAPRDAQRHPWYAGHGYASVRVDVRGHGNSEGTPGDACSEEEVADGAEVIEWLASRPWCSGRVGMFGISWGGSNSLRLASLAALAPEPLRAVVTVCGTDAHYRGGSVLAEDMHMAAATMLAHAARPPDPLYADEADSPWQDLRDRWVRRLEAMEPPGHTWLTRQTRDTHQREGGPEGPEDSGAIRAAVLAVGGWRDPHCDTVLRLVRNLPSDRVRGIIGPWSQQYPDRELPPGPAIGFLQETLRWWDHWLKDLDTGVLAEPLLRSYLTGGRWVGDESWPPPTVSTVGHGLRGSPVVVRSPQHTGLDAGRFVPLGGAGDLPPDQREEDGRSACFEFEVPGEKWLLGRPRVRLRLTSPVERGQVAARLCDVAPDGSSTLVTRGVLNLSARHGAARAVPWPPGTTEEVTFELDPAGHVFRPGQRIRLAVSSAYWPWIWPQVTSEFTLDPAGSLLELPLRERDSGPPVTFGEPEQAQPLDVIIPTTLDEPRPPVLVVRDLAAGTRRLEVDPSADGTRVHPDGLEYTEETRTAYTIQESDPLTAHAHSDWTIRLHRPELAWNTTVLTHSDLTATATDFIASDEVICKDGAEVVFHRTWEKRVPRTAA